jgi:hypothetical protein
MMYGTTYTLISSYIQTKNFDLHQVLTENLLG